jgi:hypothetical protein
MSILQIQDCVLTVYMISVRVSPFCGMVDVICIQVQSILGQQVRCEVINLVSYVLQQLVCVIFKYETFLQNFKHC